MQAFTLYLALHHAGLSLKTDGQKLVVAPARCLNEELCSGIQQHKSALIELLQSAHHTTGRLLDWEVDLAPDISAATAIRFRTASLKLDAQIISQKESDHDRTE